MRPTAILFLISLALAGCEPCADYCARACECADSAEDGCAETCLQTMDVYSGPERADECDARLTVLEETCR